jgi:hypothetical protein
MIVVEIKVIKECKIQKKGAEPSSEPHTITNNPF